MMPKKLLEPSFTASFVLSSEQITKLGIWGKNQSITLRFEEYDIGKSVIQKGKSACGRDKIIVANEEKRFGNALTSALLASPIQLFALYTDSYWKQQRRRY